MSSVQHLTVGDDEAEQRLDRWFRRLFPGVNQGMLERMCRKGEIRVDGGRVKPASRVAPGQVVRIPPLPPDADAPPELGEGGGARDEPSDDALARELETRIVHLDDQMIVLDKPPGLAVQGGSGQHRHLGRALPGLRFGRPDDPRLVHRLDRDTSGLLILARTGSAAVALARAFRTRAVSKTYLAVVAGRPSPEAGTVRYGLVKAGGRGDGERMRAIHPDEIATTEGARRAVTDYRVLESAGTRAAVVALRPVTGRTHQLRAHMAAIGTPIAGDGKYGGRGQENDGSGWGAGLGQAVSRKLHLHAAVIGLQHPLNNRWIEFSAPLPDHIRRTFELFGWSERLLDGDLLDRR